MKRNDFNKLMRKYQPVAKKAGEQLTKAMKSAEEDISKMYRIAQAHVEIQMKNLQKEKLYHELGRYVAGKLVKEDLNVPGLESFKKRLVQIDSEGNKMKKKLSRITRVRGRKKTANKNKKGI